MKSTIICCVLVFATVVGITTVAAALQNPTYTPPVVGIDLPLKLPAVGNIEAVQQWRFAHIQEVQMIAGSSDVILRLRTGDGVVHRIIGPGPQLSDLARQSNWVRFDTKSFPTARDIDERLIAFDADGSGRLIAMISMEPINRDPNRLRRALAV